MRIEKIIIEANADEMKVSNSLSMSLSDAIKDCFLKRSSAKLAVCEDEEEEADDE